MTVSRAPAPSPYACPQPFTVDNVQVMYWLDQVRSVLDHPKAMIQLARSYLATTDPNARHALPTVLMVLTVWCKLLLNRPLNSAEVEYEKSVRSVLDPLIGQTPGSALEFISIEGYLVAGCIAHALGNLDLALEFNHSILKLRPEHIQALSNVAIIHRSLNNLADAEATWRHVLRLKPGNWDAMEHLVSVLALQDRQIDAIKYLRPIVHRAFDMSRHNYWSMGEWNRILGLAHTLGNLYASTGDNVMASQYFSAIVLLSCHLMIPWDISNIERTSGVGSQIHTGSGIPTVISLIEQSFPQGNLVSPQFAVACRHSVFPNGIPHPQYKSDTATYGGGGNDNTSSKSRTGSNSSSDRSNSVSSSSSLSPGSSPSSSSTSLDSNSAQHDFYYQKTNNDNSSKNMDAHTSNSLHLVIANALLNLAKVLQDGVNSGVPTKVVYLNGLVPTHTQILCLYMLSLALNSSPSTANNIGILLASMSADPSIPADTRSLAMEYYQYGLSLDPHHPHLYTNLGSLLREQGDIKGAIQMYYRASKCDPSFNIALANLASALKDLGHVDQALVYYDRAVANDPNFVEAVSGLANCKGTTCDWSGRGGCNWEPVSVDANGNLLQGHYDGWVPSVVRMIDKQLTDARQWGVGVIDLIQSSNLPPDQDLFYQVECALGGFDDSQRQRWQSIWNNWRNKLDEGYNLLALIEVTTRLCQRRWYVDKYVHRISRPSTEYKRPQIPSTLPIPLATTILPFHAFTLPLNTFQVRHISEKSSTRVSMSALTQSWVPPSVYPPPPPPHRTASGTRTLRVGYMSSDFVNHPLAHLMQSVFGMHNPERVQAVCYATSASDGSHYREKIEQECYLFRDVTNLTTQQLVEQIVDDGIHILVNLNGFTRGARNDVFALRPAPIQVALMGFAGPMGAGWSDYLLADHTAVASEGRNVYKEKIMYMPRSFFCCDHRQSASDSNLVRTLEGKQLHTWEDEKQLRADLRQKMFPNLPKDAFLMANFNQLYKIDPTTLRNWLNILLRVPNAHLWLLQFPKAGEANILDYAVRWTGDPTIVKRIFFTPVADKHLHIFRSRVCDLFLDTPECNAHTTAADVTWNGTPIVTFPRHQHKLCSRIAASIVTSAFPDTEQGRFMASKLIVSSEEEYQERVVELSTGDLLEKMRCLLFRQREAKGGFFDTQQWVKDLENGYEMVWRDWLQGKYRDIDIEPCK